MPVLIAFINNTQSTYTITINIQGELVSNFCYKIPLFAIICMLARRQRRQGESFPLAIAFSCKKIKYFFICAGAGFCSLFLTALFVSYICNVIFALEPSAVLPPLSASPVIIIFSSFCSAYLEESFFRFFLPGTLTKNSIVFPIAVIISSVLFAVCHLWEGASGTINAFLSGIFLCLLFKRFASLHGIVFAHALFNIAAYAFANKF
ncbi:MAG: CPBP family intramembrane metalloprotease [Spirochaetaceae bacterium]|nr:CPBP family intramembrane metalloprotease [Spirochaetaceae bacterium]